MPATSNYSIVDEIKARLSVLDLVQTLVPVERLTVRGNRAVGLCPLHREKTPSFNVYLDQNTWHCFGCHRGGDVIALYAQYRGISNGETIKELANYLGLSRNLSPAEQRRAMRNRRKLREKKRLESAVQERIREVFGMLADTERRIERYMLALRDTGRDPLEDHVACDWLRAKALVGHWLDLLTFGSEEEQLEVYLEVQEWLSSIR